MSIIGDGIMLGAGGEAASIFVTGLSETDTVTATNGSKTLTGKWTQKPNPAYVTLPAGYTQLEYIESTGTQYINTLLSLPHGWRIKGKLLLTSVTTDSRAVFGAQAQNGSVWARNQFQPSWGSNNWFIGIGGYQYGGSPQANTEYEFDVCNIVGETSYIKINGENVALTTGQTDTGARSDLSCYLFNVHNGDGTNYFGQFRMIGKWEVYNENHNLVGNYVPAKRNSDGEIAVYDLVTQDFLPNAGTGEFVSGPEVPQTIDGFLISKIKDYGTWAVTATDGTEIETKTVLVDSAMEYNIEMKYLTYISETPDMTSNTTPSGRCSDSANTAYSWRAFRYATGEDNVVRLGCPSYVQYNLAEGARIKLRKVRFLNPDDFSYDTTSVGYISVSEDGETFTNVYDFSLGSATVHTIDLGATYDVCAFRVNLTQYNNTYGNKDCRFSSIKGYAES